MAWGAAVLLLLCRRELDIPHMRAQDVPGPWRRSPEAYPSPELYLNACTITGAMWWPNKVKNGASPVAVLTEIRSRADALRMAASTFGLPCQLSLIAFRRITLEKWSTSINIHEWPPLDFGYLHRSIYSFWNGVSDFLPCSYFHFHPEVGRLGLLSHITSSDDLTYLDIHLSPIKVSSQNLHCLRHTTMFTKLINYKITLKQNFLALIHTPQIIER